MRPAEALLTLSRDSLRAVASFLDLPSPSARVTPLAVARALVARPASSSPSKRATFLSLFTRFATSGAAAALLEAAHASRSSLAPAIAATPAADLAATLLLDRTNAKPRARRVLDRLLSLATHRLDRDLPSRPTYELLANPDSPPPRDAARLLSSLDRARPLRDRLVSSLTASDPDGTARLALLLRQPPETRLVADDASPDGFTARTDVPVAFDHVRVAPDGSRVALTLTDPTLLSVYAAALGLSLRPSFTLRPVRHLTAARLASLSVSGVARVELVAARVRRPDGSRRELRGPAILDELPEAARAGYVDRATFRITLSSGAHVDVFLQLPHRVDFSDPDHEAPARAVLDALGLFAPGALPDDARSLAPYEHPEWRWRAVLGDEAFERLRDAGRLVRVDGVHVTSEEHRMHGAGYVVREVPGEPDLRYALAEDRSLGARLVSAQDRVTWRLDVDALRAAMMRDLGAAPADAPLAIDGVIDLGVVTLASGRLRFAYAMSEPPSGWRDRLRRACPLGMTPVVLVPKDHESDGGVTAIALDVAEQLGARPIGRALGRAAEALGVPDEVAIWRRWDEDLLVERATTTVWMRGVRVLMAVRPHGLLLHLAETPRTVATKDLGARLSNAGSPDVTARKAKAEVEKQLLDAGIDPADVSALIVADGKKGYRLAISARVV